MNCHGHSRLAPETQVGTGFPLDKREGLEVQTFKRSTSLKERQQAAAPLNADAARGKTEFKTLPPQAERGEISP